MRKLKINPSVSPEGGYIAHTIAKSALFSAPISAWTQFYHKPYSLDDWREAKKKALARCKRDALAPDSVIKPASVAEA